jgi:hypothetical protein
LYFDDPIFCDIPQSAKRQHLFFVSHIYDLEGNFAVHLDWELQF